MTGMNRRRFLQSSILCIGAGILNTPAFPRSASLTGVALAPQEPDVFHPPMMTFPEKKAMLMHSDSPPLLETSRSAFAEAITPNDQFFVRWHHAVIPDSIDLNTYRISISGNVDNPLQFSLDELKNRFEPVEFFAVKQCGGNSRKLYTPTTSGIQWMHGAMGCAHWKGARLKDVLAEAKIRSNSQFIKVNGLERPVMPGTPPFQRKLDMEECGRDDVIIAYEMNGTDLPYLNGYPAVLVVPGYFADNWVKMLETIVVTEKDEPVFYTDKAYRLPNNELGSVPVGADMPEDTRPLKRLRIKSVIAEPEQDSHVKKGDQITITGVAFDSGLGIQEVLVSIDGGTNWTSAQLDKELGKYAFRKWTYHFNAIRSGEMTLMSRAVNRLGETQPLPENHEWNPAGYQWNAADRVTIHVS